METLRALAVRLDSASETLTDLSQAVPATDPAEVAFGGDAAGRPGEVGRALHRQWTAATGDRAREAHVAAQRLAAVAAAVRAAADRYVETDQAAGRRFVGET
ncbi:hypothetical protein [Salinispora arenicola]|uniref:hypothetical protein n=1 Tax=Salinispora arenicola TaxID=168697 RepID=UPI000361A97A|nr:hypothetical protein [Salinispora arenicola]MCN0181216.1 hypothetical protein [Salinispora arenicola]